MKFDDLVEYVLEHEGGYVNDPNDSGGETKYGISKRAYPDINIQLLTKEAAKEIYKHDYWDKVKGDYLPVPLRLMVFDTAVNMGVWRAAYILQKLLNVKKDGLIGLKTLAALGDYDDARLLIDYALERHMHYAYVADWDRYGKGWSKRLLDVALISMSMISRFDKRKLN